jgi:hypothetical protein
MSKFSLVLFWAGITVMVVGLTISTTIVVVAATTTPAAHREQCETYCTEADAVLVKMRSNGLCVCAIPDPE